MTHARQYKLSVVPSGAFGQVMARVSEWQDVAMVEMWRFGFVLRDAHDVAMLTVENGCDIFLRICKAPALVRTLCYGDCCLIAFPCSVQRIRK